MFLLIEKNEYSFPTGFPACVADVVRALLVLDPAQRLGLGDGCLSGLPAHPFFREFDATAPAIALDAYLPTILDTDTPLRGACRHDVVDILAIATASLALHPIPDLWPLVHIITNS